MSDFGNQKSDIRLPTSDFLHSIFSFFIPVNLRYQLIPLLFFKTISLLAINSSNVFGDGTISGSHSIQFAGVLELLLSATCKACNDLNISGIHLPTFIGYTSINLIIPLSSIMNTFLTVSVLLILLDIIPYFLAICPFLSAIIGNGTLIPVLQ